MELLTYKDDFNSVKKELDTARDKWEEIGEELGLGREDLKHLEGSKREKLRQVVEMWLQRSQLKPTWKSLADALREKEVDRPDLADEIERKHLGGIGQVRH